MDRRTDGQTDRQTDSATPPPPTTTTFKGANSRFYLKLSPTRTLKKMPHTKAPSETQNPHNRIGGRLGKADALTVTPRVFMVT